MTTLQALQVATAIEHVLVRLIEDAIEGVSLFVEVALRDPLATLMLLIGAVIVGGATAVFAGLSGGGALGWFFRFAE